MNLSVRLFFHGAYSEIAVSPRVSKGSIYTEEQWYFLKSKKDYTSQKIYSKTAMDTFCPINFSVIKPNETPYSLSNFQLFPHCIPKEKTCLIHDRNEIFE